MDSLLRLFWKASVFLEEMREDKSWSHLKEEFRNEVFLFFFFPLSFFLKRVLDSVEEFIVG